MRLVLLSVLLLTIVSCDKLGDQQQTDQIIYDLPNTIKSALSELLNKGPEEIDLYIRLSLESDDLEILIGEYPYGYQLDSILKKSNRQIKIGNRLIPVIVNEDIAFSSGIDRFDPDEQETQIIIYKGHSLQFKFVQGQWKLSKSELSR